MEEIEKAIDELKFQLEKKDLRVVTYPIFLPGWGCGGSLFLPCLEVFQLAGIEWHILTCDYIPEYLRFLKNVSSAISYQDKSDLCKQLIGEADFIFMLDHNTVRREGDLEPWVSAASASKIVIDHHPEPDCLSCVISDTRVSSTVSFCIRWLSGYGAGRLFLLTLPMPYILYQYRHRRIEP